jgi:hypothetical protein
MTAVLAFAIRLFARDDWGRAMLAELAAIDEPRARRRFALGSLRALLTRPVWWLRLAAVVLVCAVPAFLFTGPGGGGDPTGIAIVGVTIVICLVAATRLERLPVVACAGGLVWWAALLASATVRSHPQWSLALLTVCAATAAWRGGFVGAFSAAFVTSLLIFVLSVATYAALPRLAPPIAPANATNPQLENQIESTDPYVGHLLLAALFAVGLIGATARPGLAPRPARRATGS